MICLRGDVASHHFIPARPDSIVSGGSVNLCVIPLEYFDQMGWKSDWLYSLLFDRARDTLGEAQRAAVERSEPPPQFLVATEHLNWRRETSIPSGDPIRIWSSVDDFQSLLPNLPDQRKAISNENSIFDVPLISWFMPDDRKQILICRWIGPRYGNGGWWNIVGQGDSGKLTPAQRRSWIA